MLNYLRRLPSEPPLVRRRFVVAATAFSFTLIVLVWVGILSFGRKEPAATPAATPIPTPTPTPTPEISPAPSEIGLEGTPEPPAAPLVDVGQISTNLLKAFGEPQR